MKYKVGDRVEHKEFGKGTVAETCTDIGGEEFLVQFDQKHEDLHSASYGSKNGPYGKQRCLFYSTRNRNRLQSAIYLDNKVNRRTKEGLNYEISRTNREM